MRRLLNRWGKPRTGTRRYWHQALFASLEQHGLAVMVRRQARRSDQKVRSAVDHARGLGDPYALVYSLGIAAAVSQHSRNAKLTEDFASECVDLSELHLFSYWGAWGKVFGGWADAVSLVSHSELII